MTPIPFNHKGKPRISGSRANLYRPRVISAQDRRRYEIITERVISAKSFQHMVKETMETMGYQQYNLKVSALDLLHQASEDFVVYLFEQANLSCVRANGITIPLKDVSLAKRIRGDRDS